MSDPPDYLMDILVLQISFMENGRDTIPYPKALTENLAIGT